MSVFLCLVCSTEHGNGFRHDWRQFWFSKLQDALIVVPIVSKESLQSEACKEEVLKACQQQENLAVHSPLAVIEEGSASGTPYSHRSSCSLSRPSWGGHTPKQRDDEYRDQLRQKWEQLPSRDNGLHTNAAAAEGEEAGMFDETQHMTLSHYM